ncbi:MAG: hypothetical protein Q4E22_05405 [Coriobacteriia bacterium]|nr:hypothetical protein [Coriobacteriia bacterium]
MFKNLESSYYASPGAEISEWLEENEKTQAWLSEQLGRSAQFVNELINAKIRLSEDTAIDLSSVIGMSPEYWVRREGSYRLALALAKRNNMKVEQQDGTYRMP